MLQAGVLPAAHGVVRDHRAHVAAGRRHAHATAVLLHALRHRG